MEKPVLRDEDFWNVLRDKREAREILQLLQARNTELPSLLRKGTGGQKPGIDYAVFNSLVLAYFSGDTVYQDLSSCLDLYSLIRLSALKGGQSVHVPSLYEIVQAYATILGVYSVKCKKQPPHEVYPRIRRYLKSIGVPAPEFEHWKQLVEHTNKRILYSMMRKDRAGSSIYVDLRGSVKRLNEVADEILTRISETGDTKLMLWAYKELTRTVDEILECLSKSEEMLFGLLKNSSESENDENAA